MTQPEETPVSFIPSNFIEKGKILNGTFDIRNAIESIVLSLAIGIPVFHLPLSLTARIIILCMTALPAAMVALIGIGGESITAFLMNFHVPHLYNIIDAHFSIKKIRSGIPILKTDIQNFHFFPLG